MTEPTAEKHSPAKKNSGWIWIFIVLTVLSVIAVSTMILYNQAQQLSREELNTAWEKWKQKRPQNYQLIYTEKYNPKEEPKWFKVVVREGEVEMVSETDPQKEKDVLLYPDNPQDFSMDGLFAELEGFLDADEQPENPRRFTRAVFDADDGHIIWFRRVLDRKKRLEIVVEELKPLP